MLLLALIDFIWGLLILFYQVKKILRRGTIIIFDFTNLMFAFVYGFLPAIILFQCFLGIHVYKIDTSSEGIYCLFFVTIISMIIYFFMNLAYRVTNTNTKLFEINDNVAKVAGFLMLIIGWGSLFLWTLADGGIFNFIKHADGIRAGYYQLQNPFAFLQHVTRILVFAGCLMFAIWFQQKGIIKKLKLFLPMIMGVLGAFLFISAWDSRATFGLFVLTNILVCMDKRMHIKKENLSLELVKLIMVFVAVLVLIVASKSIMDSFRFEEFVSSDSTLNIIDIIANEFSFIIRTQQAVLGNFFNGTINFNIQNDIINALTVWIPKRFIPFDVPYTLWQCNTLLVNRTLVSGTIPTDILSYSVFSLWLLGIILIPCLYGSVLKCIDVILYNEEYNLFTGVLKCLLCSHAILHVSHFAIANILGGIFYIVLGFIITLFIKNFLKYRIVIRK